MERIEQTLLVEKLDEILERIDNVQAALAGGHRCAAQRPDCAPSGHPLDGRSGHREMTPGSRFPILQAADLGLIRTVKCFVARFKILCVIPACTSLWWKVRLVY